MSRKIRGKLAGEGIVTMTRGDSWEDASCCLACLRSADTKLTRQRDMHKRTRLLRKRSKSWISDHPVSKTNADKVQKKKRI